jgi:outer membrane lipoprotein-sorting protein
MLRKALLALAGAALLAPASAQTLDEILAKNLEARGGADKIKAVKTMRLTGRMTVGPGLEAPVVMEFKRPGKMRMDFTFQGMTGTQAFDGQGGWQVMPFQGNPNPEPMSPDDVKDAEEQADVDGPLVDWKAKGHAVELVGKEKVEGTDAWKLKITMKGGDVRYVFLDADAYLEIRGEGKRKIRGTEMETEQTVSDYKEVGGLVMPHAFEGGPKGSPMRQKITIDKIELDVDIDDARFAMPAKKDAPAPAAK